MNAELLHWSEWARSLSEEDATSEETSRGLSEALSGIEDLTRVLWRLLDDLEEGIQTGTVEQRIAKNPQTMKLLSRLLKIDIIIYSEAADPLFACMACLLPALWGRPGHQTMRDRCGGWCRERLHAALRGMNGDGSGFRGSGCGNCLSMDLLYDCGLSHSDILCSLTDDAQAQLIANLDHWPTSYSGVSEVSATISILAEADMIKCGTWAPHAFTNRSPGALADNFGAFCPSMPCSESSFLLAARCDVPNAAAVDKLVLVHEDILLKRIEVLLRGLSTESPLTEGQVCTMIEKACQGGFGCPWVGLGIQEGLEAALRSFGSFHPHLALALSELSHARAGLPRVKMHAMGCDSHEFVFERNVLRSDWLWKDWAVANGGLDGWSLEYGFHGGSLGYGPLLETEAQGEYEHDADWPRACSLWIWEGPDALIDAFTQPEVDFREDMSRHAKVLTADGVQRNRFVMAAHRIYGSFRQGLRQAQGKEKSPASSQDLLVDAVRHEWNRARFLVLVFSAAILGAEGCSRTQASFLSKLLTHNLPLEQPAHVTHTILHVLRRGMIRTSSMALDGTPSTSHILENLWCIYAEVLCSWAGGQGLTGDRYGACSAVSQAIEAAGILAGHDDLKSQALALAKKMSQGISQNT